MSEVPTLAPYCQVHILGLAPYTTGSFPFFFLGLGQNPELGYTRLLSHTPAPISSWQLPPVHIREEVFMEDTRERWERAEDPMLCCEGSEPNSRCDRQPTDRACHSDTPLFSGPCHQGSRGPS